VCRSFQELIPSTTMNMSDYTPETESAWKCGGSGSTLTCPTSQRSIGSCSSATDTECSGHCQPSTVTAEYCSEPSSSSPYQLSTEEGHWVDGHDGHFATCSGPEVVCATCLSGDDSDCSGVSGRWKCCKMLDCTPSNVTGYWEAIGGGYGPGSSMQVSFGVSTTSTTSYTQGTAVAVQNSMTAGFTFGVSPSCSIGASTTVTGSYAKSCSMTVSQSLSMSVEVTTVAACNLPTDWVQWQYRYNVEGQCAGVVYTNFFTCTENMYTPPCCLPGYSNATEANPNACATGSPTVCI
jgi:hypothetical protein